MQKEAILVTGGNGQIGGAIRALSHRHPFDIIAPGRTEIDLANEQSIVDALGSRSWLAVINCAAYTMVDKAEDEQEVAHRINAIAPGILARETARRKIPIIQVSTDYVFDGTKASSYREDDPVNPISVYGATKLAGECAVRKYNDRHAIIRTAWVMSVEGQNFLNTMLRIGRENSTLNIVNDQIGCPSSASDIAETLLTVVEHLGQQSGTWHFVNSGEATWFDLADFIFKTARSRGIDSPEILPISTVDYPTPAKRPPNSRLATGKISADFGISPRPWQTAIDEILFTRLSQLSQ